MNMKISLLVILCVGLSLMATPTQSARLAGIDLLDFEDWAEVTLKRGSLLDYNDYEEMIQQIDNWMSIYPDVIVEKVNIGLSYQGLTIWAYRFTHNPDEVDPSAITGRYEILVDAMHSGHELLAGDMAMYLIGRFIYGFEKAHSQIMTLLEKYDTWIIPCLNPDGITEVKQRYDETERIELISKNRHDYSGDDEECASSSIGVDLTRNYDYSWQASEGSSSEPCHRQYRGPGAFSEPETAAMRDFISNHSFNFAINLFAGQNQVMIPFACCEEESYPKIMYQKLYEELPNALRAPQSLIGTNFELTGKVISGHPSDYMLLADLPSINQYIAHPDKIGENAPSDLDIRMEALGNNIDFTLSMIQKGGIQLQMSRTSEISCRSCGSSWCDENESKGCDLKVLLTNVGLSDTVNGEDLVVRIYFDDDHYRLHQAWDYDTQLPFQQTTVVLSDTEQYTAYLVEVQRLKSFEGHQLAFQFIESNFSDDERDDIFSGGQLPSFVIEVLPEEDETYLHYTEHLTDLVVTFRYNNLPDDYFDDQPSNLEKKTETKKYFFGFLTFTGVYLLIALLGKCCLAKRSEDQLRTPGADDDGDVEEAKVKKIKNSRAQKLTKANENLGTDAGMLVTDE